MRRTAIGVCLLAAAAVASDRGGRFSSSHDAGAAPAGVVRPARVVGRSVEGRPIRAFRVGDRSSARKALVVGSMHGNEWAGLRVVEALRGAHVANVDLWVVPTINPDGLRAGVRQNARGVDLNRNFPYRWRRAGHPWSSYYSGRRPLSEPETRVVRRLTRTLRPHVSIWYHQPWGHVVLPRRRQRAARRYARVARFPARRLRGRRARLRGTAVSWQRRVLPGRTAFVVELPAAGLSSRQARRHAHAVLRVSAG